MRIFLFSYLLNLLILMPGSGKMVLREITTLREIAPGYTHQMTRVAALYASGPITAEARPPSLTGRTRDFEPGEYDVEEITVALTRKDILERIGHWVMAVKSLDGTLWGESTDHLESVGAVFSET